METQLNLIARFAPSEDFKIKTTWRNTSIRISTHQPLQRPQALNYYQGTHFMLLWKKFRQYKFLPFFRLGGDGQSISSMSSSSSTSSTSTGNNHNQRHNDFLLAQELERRERERLKHEEQKEFDQLRAQFGMDNDGNFHTQSISNMQNAVYRGEMSVVDYYERQVGGLYKST